MQSTNNGVAYIELGLSLDSVAPTTEDGYEPELITDDDIRAAWDVVIARYPGAEVRLELCWADGPRFPRYAEDTDGSEVSDDARYALSDVGIAAEQAMQASILERIPDAYEHDHVW